MKKTLFFLLTGIASLTAYAQQAPRNTDHLLLEKFAPGVAYFHGGGKVETSLNYTVLYNRLQYTENGEIYDVGNQDQISRVVIDSTVVLVPDSEGGFFRVYNQGKGDLYFKRTGQVILADKKDPYGGNLPASNSARVSMAYSDFSRLFVVPSDYTVKLIDKYYILRDGQYIPFMTLKEMQKAFPDKADAIKAYVKKNKIKFKTAEDRLSVLDFCLE